MRSTLLRLSALLLLSATLALPSPAQARLGAVERRPRLAADADTNDANAYFAHGARILEEKPSEAAQAFYWAARLDPGSADALDGRRAAMIMRRQTTLRMYIEGGRRARESKDLKALDSLALRALRLDPLYYRKYDHTMLMTYYRNMMRADYPTASPAEIDRVIRDYLYSGSPYMRAWVAYGEGRFQTALADYDLAAKQSRNPGYIRLERGRVFALQGMFPAAIGEFRLASEALAKRDNDRDEDVVFYNSRAMVEHSLAISYFRNGQVDSARAALGRSIGEDLSYFMAHVELGRLALASKDTVTAVSELALAADLAVDEPYVHYLHGSVLLAAGQAADAIAPLRKAIELEPLHAASHFELAAALERTGDKTEARASYQRFLSMAARRDVARRTTAAERLAGLQP